MVGSVQRADDSTRGSLDRATLCLGCLRRKRTVSHVGAGVEPQLHDHTSAASALGAFAYVSRYLRTGWLLRRSTALRRGQKATRDDNQGN